MTKEDDEARAFLAWQVLGAGFTDQFISNRVSTSVTFAPFGVFVIPVSDDFGLPRGQVGLALSFAFLAMGIIGPLVGRWLDRGWTRTMMLPGVVLSGSGLIAMQVCHQTCRKTAQQTSFRKKKTNQDTYEVSENTI